MTAHSVLTDPWPAPTATAPVAARVRLPGSKSMTNRALVIAALATGPSMVRGALRSRDTVLMATALTALGACVETTGPDWSVTPGRCDADAAVDCGLAGTVLRFVPPMAPLAGVRVRFDGDPHMRTRPIGRMLAALQTLGATVDGDRLPFAIVGHGGMAGGRVVIDASASSQLVSGLLLSGARYRRGVDVTHEGKPIPSQPHLDMTVAMLRAHGVDVDDSWANRWTVAPGPIRPVDHVIEPDLSNAAPFLALAAVTRGRVEVPDWPAETTQAGDELRHILTRFGCTVALTPDGLTVTGPDNLCGVELDLHDHGELTPSVAALCALADSPSHLTGIAHIRAHETDRLAALTRELSALGADITEHDDGLTIRPARLHGGLFHTYADHRMAHAGCIIGAVVPGVAVENVATTGKTFPGFAEVWARLL